MGTRRRTARRAMERELGKLEDARERLARLSAGGAPERPLGVESASLVEPRALALGCARCEGELRLEAHEAVGGLRRVHACCKQCRATREVWLRVESRLLS